MLGDAIVDHALAIDRAFFLGVERGRVVLEILDNGSGLPCDSVLRSKRLQIKKLEIKVKFLIQFYLFRITPGSLILKK